MKGNSRAKVSKKIGGPSFRTPSFFKNKQRVIITPKILVNKSTKSFSGK